jgi:CubicO group peptidase (beta-lactamase class C family)
VTLRRRPAVPFAPGFAALAALALALLIAAPATPALHAQSRATAPGLPRDLDAWVARTLKEFGQPGLAVAVVKDGRVVLTKGYGMRDIAGPALADAHTIYQIASNTKAFTTALLAMLVDEKKLRWDDRVTDYLPWFELSDPYVTREFTIRDLITHRSGLGLGAGDLLWWHSDYDRKEIVHRLRTLRPVTSFRSAYAYDNVLYIAAGLVVEAVTGQSWDDVVKERILEPLGMTEATTSVKALPANGDIAVPYGKVDGKLVLVPRDTVDNTGPAGGINANVTDIAKWLVVQLDSGRAGDRRLWSQARAKEMWTGVTPLPIGNVPASAPMLAPLRANFSLYGLGWFLRDYRGMKLATHTGGLSGMVSRTILVPDIKLGIVVLTNGETESMDAVAFHILDGYLGAPPTDWIAGFRTLGEGAESSADSVMKTQEAARDRTSKPSLPLARYAGRYTDAMYGDATIALEGDHLVLRFSHSPAFVGDLEHWQYDTFVARWRSRALADAFVTFALDPDGSIATMRLAAVSPLADFSFDYQDLLFRPASGE